MARSPLTLAASVTAALPRTGVVSVAPLSEGAAGRYDSAVAELDDGRRVVVRVPTDADATAEMIAEIRVLRLLSAGVRALLPFRAPIVLGEGGLDDGRLVVVDLLTGYRVEAAHIPAGPGAASSLGAAIAAVHALPVSFVRSGDLPMRTPADIRDDLERLVARAEDTGRLPASLSRRWGTALDHRPLWRFDATVVLDGVNPASFLFDDGRDGPVVTGLLDWHGLSAGDPALDFRWLASAPTAADAVLTAYGTHSHRAPDAMLRERARLYAELEFARWLVHGQETGDAAVTTDAADLLLSLADGLGGEPLVAAEDADVEDAIALIGQLPEPPATATDTSMRTDTYDPEQLSLFLADDAADGTADRAGGGADVETDTAPIAISRWVAQVAAAEAGVTERAADAEITDAAQHAAADTDAPPRAG